MVWLTFINLRNRLYFPWSPTARARTVLFLPLSLPHPSKLKTELYLTPQSSALTQIRLFQMYIEHHKRQTEEKDKWMVMWTENLLHWWHGTEIGILISNQQNGPPSQLQTSSIWCDKRLRTTWSKEQIQGCGIRPKHSLLKKMRIKPTSYSLDRNKNCP